MDEFEKRLKRDAQGIDADISPQLASRIEASLRSVERIESLREKGSATSNLWWASSLTGLAAAAAVIALLNWNRPDPEPVLPEQTAFQVVPDAREYLQQMQGRFPLRTETADFTHGLEDELTRLQADFEKARENVNRDIDFTF
jgi:molecular chaperone GrpE (heat shock protein)